MLIENALSDAVRFFHVDALSSKVPLVLKAGYGFAAGWAGQHTGSLTALFMGWPGLKVVVPSTAADAKGLMATAIRDDNPVVFLHHYMLTLEEGEVPDGEHLLPFGKAEIRRAGKDVTVIATGWMVPRALSVAQKLAGEGIDVEVIDPRTVAPLDLETILKSVGKTRRVVLVDQAPRQASVSVIIAADIVEHGFSSRRPRSPARHATGPGRRHPAAPCRPSRGPVRPRVVPRLAPVTSPDRKSSSTAAGH